MKTLLITLIATLFSMSVYAWGNVETSNLDDIIIIKGNAKGQFIILPKLHLTTIIDTTKTRLIFQYGSAKKPIRTMFFDDPKDALQVLKQIYPDYYCLDKSGVEKCKIDDIIGANKKEEESEQ